MAAEETLRPEPAPTPALPRALPKSAPLPAGPWVLETAEDRGWKACSECAQKTKPEERRKKGEVKRNEGEEKEEIESEGNTHY